MSTTPSPALTAGASYESDWHVYFTDSARGPIGLCAGTHDAPFDPAAATAQLAAEGWQVAGEWVETPPSEEYQFAAIITPLDSTTNA